MSKTLRELLDSEEPAVCIVQGGGMRGTYSIAALAELEAEGYTNRFSAIYGSSAGALNGAYFLAGQAEEGVGIYVDHLSGRQFINPLRIARIIDIDYLVDVVLQRSVPLNQEAVLQSKTELDVYLTNAETGEGARFIASERKAPLMELFRATAALPVVFGREVEINGHKYSDGGLFDQVPIREAVKDNWTNIVVIMTRPRSHTVKPSGWLQTSVMRLLARIARHSAGVVRLLGSDRPRMHEVMEVVSGRVSYPGVRVWVVAPPEGAQIASRLTSSKELLILTAQTARQDTHDALDCGPASIGECKQLRAG